MTRESHTDTTLPIALHLQPTRSILDLIENDSKMLKFGQVTQSHLNEYKRPGPGRNKPTPSRRRPSELTGFSLGSNGRIDR
jgi:hypothetical protein